METIALICGRGSSQESLFNALRESGYGLNIFLSVDEAIAAFKIEKPAAVFFFVRDLAGKKKYSDYEEMFKLAREISPVPCGLVSSSASPDIYARALQNGIFHLINVPCGKSHLLDRVRDVVQSRNDAAGQTGFPIDFSVRDDAYSVNFTGTGIKDFTRGSIVEQAHKNAMLGKCMTGRLPVQRSMVGEMEAFAPDIHPGLYKELERALEKREYRLYYQPIVDLKEGHISGFEALLRWQHPDRGLIPPAEFISDLEKSDLIVPVGYWAIDEASRQIGEWNGRFVSPSPMSMSINVSPRQFVHHELAEKITTIVHESGAPSLWIRFEITESAFMVDMEAANLMLLKLKAENFTLCMDDFGTGYSSLTYLKHFPVDVLKVDQSFVKYMEIDEESELIVKAVIALAHSLGKTVVAEGVESADHLNLLREFGCDYGQGYYFSPPLPAHGMEKILEQNLRW